MNALLPIDATGIATVAAVAALIYLAWLGPRLNQARECRAAAVELSARLDEAARLRAELAQAEARAREIRMRVEQAPRFLRPLDAMNARLSELTNLAVECGLSLETLSPGQPSRLERLVRVPVRMAGRGGYADCVRFLEAVHARFPDVEVEGLRLVSPGESGGPASFAIDCAWLADHSGTPTTQAAPKG
jgi:Tfp pilus assembly protein PilO